VGFFVGAFMLTQEILKSVLCYAPETGEFNWINSPRRNVKSGAKAGSIDKKGYVRILYKQKLYLAHRLAWMYVHGKWPEQDIDHINRNPTDNRICNLRDVSRKHNMENKKIYKTNKSGFSGITWHSRDKKWNVRIGHNNQRISLGYFENLDDAVDARKKAEMQIYTHQPKS
jgi:hypothetical protein